MDDEIYEGAELTPEAPEEAPVSEDVSAPKEPSEVLEADPAAGLMPDFDPAPAVPSDPVEVISVEDLPDRLAGESQEDGQTEEPPPEEEPMDYIPENDLAAAQVDGGPIEVIGMDKALKHLETIQGIADHPMMETHFEEYTVTEGLLLLIFVIVALDFFLNFLRRWF